MDEKSEGRKKENEGERELRNEERDSEGWGGVRERRDERSSAGRINEL